MHRLGLLTTSVTNESKMQNWVKGVGRGHETYFCNFETPSISRERSELETSNLVRQCKMPVPVKISRYKKLTRRCDSERELFLRQGKSRKTTVLNRHSDGYIGGQRGRSPPPQMRLSPQIDRCVENSQAQLVKMERSEQLPQLRRVCHVRTNE